MNLQPAQLHEAPALKSTSLSPAASHIVSRFGHRRVITCSSKQDLKGQTVVVVGLGVSGRSAAKLALTRGASVIAVDKNENLIPLEHDSTFEKHGYLKTILGHCEREVLENADRVVVSPGVPIQNYGLSLLLQSGQRVMSELDFAAEVLPKSMKILAVTGTNGKSTVTTFAGQRLKVFLFVAVPSFPLILLTITIMLMVYFQVAVVEVSSYQMEMPNKYFYPSVAVVLNLTPDHLERHETMMNYAAAKCRVFSHMNYSKLAILPIGMLDQVDYMHFILLLLRRNLF
ncbi:hypothetical protein IFM89_006930 [Coptis chinensis]|uniref:Mur ligase central domain-containing protein n=1 Tax=Coptis chinensis TaxID=261450 RepID=A0A835LHQ9_9MAGN|nr:hypothetical protein IFM89_006930 [Coptis chinensis]